MLYKFWPKCVNFTHLPHWEQTTVRFCFIFHCFTLFYLNLIAIAHKYKVFDTFCLFLYVLYIIHITFAKPSFPRNISSRNIKSRRGISNLVEEYQNLVEENQNLSETNQNLAEENQISSRKIKSHRRIYKSHGYILK